MKNGSKNEKKKKKKKKNSLKMKMDRKNCFHILAAFGQGSPAPAGTPYLALWAYSGEVSNFCHSPSSRSESAMLSTDSSMSGTGSRTSSQQVTSLPSRDRVSFVSGQIGTHQIPSLLQ